MDESEEALKDLNQLVAILDAPPATDHNVQVNEGDVDDTLTTTHPVGGDNIQPEEQAKIEVEDGDDSGVGTKQASVPLAFP